MHAFGRILATTLLLCGLMACGDSGGSSGTTPEPDAGNNGADAAEELDTGTEDIGEPEEDTAPEPLEASYLFGPCVEDSQCPGVGAICRTAAEDGDPGGFCTVPCEDRTPCDANNVYHHCLTREGSDQGYCERRCLNGLDCGRSTYTCQPPPEGAPEGGVCFGFCSSDEHCGEGNQCDPYTGRCSADAPSDEGAVTGEGCAVGEDCRSNWCITEADSGWPGGSCISGCIIPPGFNSTAFFTGDELPQGDCLEGSVCLAILGTLTRGDYGACMAGCETAADCRPGYTCRKSFEGSGGVSNYSNGVCWPNG